MITKLHEDSGGQGFGTRLRALRRGSGISATELAKALGVSKSSVTNWETGISTPGHALVPRICAQLGVSPDDLYGYPGTEGALTPEERRALRLYRLLPALQRRNIDSLMGAMLDNAAAALREDCLAHWCVRRRLSDRVCAGSGTELFGSGEGEPCFLPFTPETADCDAVIRITGDSMEPTYHDGEDLLVRYAPEVRPGEIGIFLVGGQGTVKEYRADGLHPHNPAYSVIRPEEGTPIRCVARVMGALTEAMLPDAEHLRVLSDLLASGDIKEPE